MNRETSPFLEEAADRYRAEDYFYKYARRALGCTASFGDWLRTHRVPLHQITDEHVNGFLDWFAPRLPEKGTTRRMRAYSAAYFVLALIRAKHPLVLVQSLVQQEVARYVDLSLNTPIFTLLVSR